MWFVVMAVMHLIRHGSDIHLTPLAQAPQLQALIIATGICFVIGYTAAVRYLWHNVFVLKKDCIYSILMCLLLGVLFMAFVCGTTPD